MIVRLVGKPLHGKAIFVLAITNFDYVGGPIIRLGMTIAYVCERKVEYTWKSLLKQEF